MSKTPAPEKSLLFLNNLAGDDLWEYGHQMLPAYEKHAAPLELLRFKRAARGRYNSDGVYVTSVPYSLTGHGPVQLYGFPFLSIDVDPFDVEYPVPVQGLIITEDMRMFDYFMEQDPNFFNIANPRFSRLAWAEGQSLPTVLAVHHAEDHVGDLERLSRLVGLKVSCPIVWHAGKLDGKFLNQAVHAVFAGLKQV